MTLDHDVPWIIDLMGLLTSKLQILRSLVSSVPNVDMVWRVVPIDLVFTTLFGDSRHLIERISVLSMNVLR
jgi:hypothetical protein